jgi:MiaB/RimO family radical SAM methylthiotransferase
MLPALRRSAGVAARLRPPPLPAAAAHSTAAAAGRLKDVPSLKEFVKRTAPPTQAAAAATADEYVSPADLHPGGLVPPPPGGSFYLETMGCQMNENDSEIVHSVLAGAGYARTDEPGGADVILVNTCSIREGAEQRVWNRLAHFAALKRQRAADGGRPVVTGVLGCMAERLKTRLVESDKAVDVVAGPDAYRDLPRLVSMVRGGESEHAVNVQLSYDETYADIAPVRTAGGGAAGRRVSAYVSIMRGCSNMCAFCVVPFTRGRERSRDAGTVVDEVRRLADEGYREVTLLGQNVNSYHDAAGASAGAYAAGGGAGYVTSRGFSNMYRLRDGPGVRFAELLDRVSAAAPGVRIRFTSPHPKDFPDDLLQLIAERPNLAKQVHLPAQSGSTRVLAAMRRGYTREAYLQLTDAVRAAIPGVALSTDLISGFCGETEADHADTVSLVRAVRYEHAFIFAYSLRERTHAAYKLMDDVPQDVKLRRLNEVIAAFRAGAAAALAGDVGRTHLVLVDGPGRKSTPGAPLWRGRTDCNKTCVFPADVPVHGSLAALTAAGGGVAAAAGTPLVRPQPGDWVAVRVTGVGTTSLRAVAVTTLQEFAAWQQVAARTTAATASTLLTQQQPQLHHYHAQQTAR